ncbi:MAG: putative chaperone protein, partial [Arenicella sp.]
MKHVGLDFGTANTSVAISSAGQTDVLNLEGQGGSIPSTLFFDFEDGTTVFGEAAFERYYFGDRGRFLRSFKSALGTSTVDHIIRIKLNTYSIKDIIQQYIGEVLSRAETKLDAKIRNLVVGRPVSFVDDNPEADRLAEAALRDVVTKLGVDNIEFQLEPIAAALNYGVTVTG